MIYAFVNVLFLFTLSNAQDVNTGIYNTLTGQEVEIKSITPSEILSSSLCYEGNRTSKAVELAQLIRNHDFDFEGLGILSSWAYVRRGGEIEITWSSSIGGSYSILTGVSLIRNCEDLRL